MLVTFKELPDESRVWIYQSNRIFTNKELNYIRAYSCDFLNKWTAHGSDLQAGIDIPYDRFIVIGLNESIKSKPLKLKNLRIFRGNPLFYWPLILSKKSNHFL